MARSPPASSSTRCATSCSAPRSGHGAYLNDRRMRVSRRSDMRMALIGCGLPIQNWKGRELGFTRQMERVADECGGLRRLGVGLARHGLRRRRPPGRLLGARHQDLGHRRRRAAGARGRRPGRPARGRRGAVRGGHGRRRQPRHLRQAARHPARGDAGGHDRRCGGVVRLLGGARDRARASPRAAGSSAPASSSRAWARARSPSRVWPSATCAPISRSGRCGSSRPATSSCQCARRSWPTRRRCGSSWPMRACATPRSRSPASRSPMPWRRSTAAARSRCGS